jgi:hypothetical protein
MQNKELMSLGTNLSYISSSYVLLRRRVSYTKQVLTALGVQTTKVESRLQFLLLFKRPSSGQRSRQTRRSFFF